MPYDREHGVLVWGGSLPGGETWSNSVRMAETLDLTNDAAGWDVQELLNTYTTVVTEFHQRSNSMIASSVKLNYVKFNRVDISGHYIDPTTFRNDFVNVSGAGTPQGLPNQVSLVATLTTAVSRGPANKGRIFLPIPSAPADSTSGLISEANAENIMGSVKTLIEHLNDAPGIDGTGTPNVAIMSKTGSGATHLVTGVRIGRVLDTMRRRRRSLPESYKVVGGIGP